MTPFLIILPQVGTSTTNESLQLFQNNSINMPVVTITDYVIVYPSPPVATVDNSIQTLPTMTNSDILSDIQSEVLSIISASETPESMIMTTTMTMSMATPTPYFSRVPAFSWSPTPPVSSRTGISPTTSPTKAPHVEPQGGKGWRPDLAALSLAAIIISALLVLALIGYAIFTRLRKGKCSPEGESMKEELRKYKNGELKPITVAMVAAREQRESMASRATEMTEFPHGDLERGEAFDHEPQWQSEAAFVPPVPVKQSPWARMTRRVKVTLKRDRSVDSMSSVADTDLSTHFPCAPSASDNYYRPNSIAPQDYQPNPNEADYHYCEPQSPVNPITTQSSHAPLLSSVSDLGLSPIVTDMNAICNAVPPPGGHEYDVSPVEERRTAHESYMSGRTIEPKHPSYVPYCPPGKEHLAPPDQRDSIISSSLLLSNPAHKPPYEAAQAKIASGHGKDEEMREAAHVCNVVEGQMHRPKRVGGYGGLGVPSDPVGMERIPQAATNLREPLIAKSEATYDSKGKGRMSGKEVRIQEDNPEWLANFGK